MISKKMPLRNVLVSQFLPTALEIRLKNSNIVEGFVYWKNLIHN